MRPLLKWAGGKRQLLPVFRPFYPRRFARYFEPFLGSGAVFFDLYGSGRIRGHDVQLSDSNADLIGCYSEVRDRTESVVDRLERLAAGHRRHGADHYYRVRKRFNAVRSRSAERGAGYTPELAAMFLYLNRTGYNGLFRLNADGEFNVPVGRYPRPTVCDQTLIRAVSAALGAVALRCCSFETAIESAGPGDFLYFDPPYEPLSETSAFGAYTKHRFTMDDQSRLCASAAALARKGCHVMLSNSSAGAVERLYAQAAAQGADRLSLWRVPARRAINSRPGGRGEIAELLLTNLPPRAPASEPFPAVRVA